MTGRKSIRNAARQKIRAAPSILSAGVAVAILAACGGEETPAQDLSPVAKGRRAFAQCAVCHAVQNPAEGAPPRLIGPNLYGVYGRKSAALADYDYSRALRALNVRWDDEALDAYIEDPASFSPGNRMSFTGEADPEARRAVIAYLKTLQSSPY